MARRTLCWLALTASLSVVPPAAAAPTFTFFRTPSGNIACAEEAARSPLLRCDILSGIRPLPPRPKSCGFDWGAGYLLFRTGRARILCVSDSAFTSAARVIAYGKTLRIGPFTCTSRRIGLRCGNAAGHGFFLSRARSYRF